MKKLIFIILFCLLLISYAEACNIYITTNYENDNGSKGTKTDVYTNVYEYEIKGDVLIIKCPNKKIMYNLKNIQKIEYFNCEN